MFQMVYVDCNVGSDLFPSPLATVSAAISQIRRLRGFVATDTAFAVRCRLPAGVALGLGLAAAQDHGQLLAVRGSRLGPRLPLAAVGAVLQRTPAFIHTTFSCQHGTMPANVAALALHGRKHVGVQTWLGHPCSKASG